jgi:F-type H+-transporting ATPase subunit delta
MRGASRASLAEAKERLETVLSSADPATLGDELFAVLRVLDREHALRRALSDPAQPPERRSRLAANVFDGKVAPATLDLLAEIAQLRWGSSLDFSGAVEQLAVTALAAGAEADGKLDDLEDELFRFGRIAAAEVELRRVLVDPRVPGERKAELVATLLEDRTTHATLRLVTEAVANPRGRTLERELEMFGRIVAERRSRLIALVRTATELSEDQRTRLAAALSAQYDREIHLNIEVDPTVLGGMSIKIGDEEIDGTIARRLADIRRRIERSS